MTFNLSYLKYFCDAIKHGSISASAKENFVTQSAISQGIGKLENHFNKKLYRHSSKSIKVTEEGDIVFSKSKEIFQSIKCLEEELASYGKEFSGTIDVACTHSFALALLPLYLKSLKDQYPLIHLNFRLGHTDLIRDWVNKGSIDFGIVLDNEDFSGFNCYEIDRGEYRLYSSNKKESSDVAVIMSEERLETNLLKEYYLRKYKLDLPILMEVSSWEVIAKLVERDLGVGFIPDYVAERRKATLHRLDLGLDPIPYKTYAIFSKGMKLSKNIKVTLDLFQTISKSMT